MNMKTPKIGSIFNENSQPENLSEVDKMTEQITKIGGMLNFTIHKDEDGWHAVCDQIPGLFAGGANPNPTDYEVESQIREAIHTAFNITSKVPLETLKTHITGVSLSLA